MLEMVPAAQTAASTKKVTLKQSGPTHETLETMRPKPCCFANSLSYIRPARRAEKSNAPSGLPNDMKLKNKPKCSKPKSSETVGINIENCTP